MWPATDRPPASDSDTDGTSARYVAIITDGNGRWARARGVPVNEGHNAGADTVKARLRDAAELGIKELTVYSFSTENWSRPPEEVRGLMDMFSRRIADETPELHEEGVRMRFIGRRDRVSPQLVERMEWAERLTGRNSRISLFVAFDYGGRAEIVDAARRFTGATEEEFRSCLYAPEMHDPDLIIRTSGERRLSNYLLWQSAYSELVFRDELWPDFSREALEQSLAEYAPAQALRQALAARGMAIRTRTGRPRRSGAPPARRRARGASRERSDLGARVLAAVPLIALALFLVIVGGDVFALGLFALGCICMHELFAMYDRAHPVRLAGFIALAGLLAGARWAQYQVLLAAVCSLPLLFALTLLQRTPSMGGLLITLLGIYWIGFALAHAELLRELPHGLGIVIDVLVGTFLGDTGAYLGGRLFGHRPLAPSISPGKTVEGLLFGMAFAVLGVWLAGRYQDWLPTSHSLVLGLAVALAAPLGDLFESFVKREAGAKDAGSVFGAHGGALDRLDAVLFTAVVGYYVWAAYVH